jgi:tRNA pseudouridine55 synthase
MKSAPERPPRRPLHGVLLLDKPRGWTSQDALAKARGLLGALKAGHTGTLDPLATGLLPLCFGAATKFSQVSLDADKRYTATLRLGQRSSTLDGEGVISEGRAPDFDRSALQAACAALTGEISQLPPMHSALKKDGRALYEYARAGVEVERAPRQVRIHRLDILRWQGDELELDVACSKGTYIRSLAADLGERLGCGAWLQALRRTGAGTLKVEDAIGIEALAALPLEQRLQRLLAPDVLLSQWPALRLSHEEAGRFLSGLRRRVSEPDRAQLRVYGPQPQAFLGSAHVRAGELIADRLLSPPEVQALLQANP